MPDLTATNLMWLALIAVAIAAIDLLVVNALAAWITRPKPQPDLPMFDAIARLYATAEAEAAEHGAEVVAEAEALLRGTS